MIMQVLFNKTAKWHNKYVETTDLFSLKIAENLRNLAAEKELTQLRLAEKSGVSQAHISRVFRGERAVSVIQVHKLAEALGTTGSEIFRQAEEAIAAEQSTNLIPFPTQPELAQFEPEFTLEIQRRSAAKTPHHPLDGHTTEHGLNYDDLGEENQDPENWAE